MNEEDTTADRIRDLSTKLRAIRNDKPGKNSLLWGFYFWRVNQYLFMSTGLNWSIAQWEQFMDLLMLVLSCSVCRDSFAIFRSIVSLRPIHETYPKLAGAIYLYLAHQWVNMKNNKEKFEEPSFSTVWNRYQTLPEQVVLDDFFTLVYFLFEHYPDRNPEGTTRVTREIYCQYMYTIVPLFAKRLYSEDKETRDAFIDLFLERGALSWSQNSDVLLRELQTMEQHWASSTNRRNIPHGLSLLPLEKRIRMIQAKVVLE